MRDISLGNFAALQARRLIARDFVRFVVRRWDNGAPVQDCYWSDIYAATAQVIDPDTGGTTSYDFAAGGSLLSISDIVLVSDLTVQTVRIKLSQVSGRVNDLVRGYDCQQGKVQIWRGLFNPETMALAAPAMPRFNGFIDEAPITTPPENDPSGDVTLSCTANTQELTRANSDTSSDASQRLRLATDNFFQDVAVVGSWEQFWGREGGPIRTASFWDRARGMFR